MELGARTATPAEDQEPLAVLEAHVRSRLGRRVREFRVEVWSGGLVLRGHARTYHEKQLAQHEVMRVSPLPIRANEITVGCLLHDGPPSPGGVRHGHPDTGSPRPFVLVATGDDRVRREVRSRLADDGYAVAVAADGIECMAVVREFDRVVDVAVLDADLLWGGADGVVENLHARSKRRVPVVLLTQRPNGTYSTGRLFSPVAVFGKPVELDSLIEALRSTVHV